MGRLILWPAMLRGFLGAKVMAYIADKVIHIDLGIFCSTVALYSCSSIESDFLDTWT